MKDKKYIKKYMENVTDRQKMRQRNVTHLKHEQCQCQIKKKIL